MATELAKVGADAGVRIRVQGARAKTLRGVGVPVNGLGMGIQTSRASGGLASGKLLGGGGRVISARKSRSHQHCINVGGQQFDVGALMHPRLTHQHHATRGQGRQGRSAVQVSFQSAQVTVVNADNAGAQGSGALHLLSLINLSEHIQTQLGGQGR